MPAMGTTGSAQRRVRAPRASGLRERKKARTREQLAAAAFHLSEARGFENVTVDEIAAEAEVSRSTFFRYFPSKESALFTWREDVLAIFDAELDRREPGESGFGAVRRACIAIGALYQRDHDHVLRHQALVDASPSLVAHELELDRRLEASMARALLDRSPRNARARRRALLLGGATHGVLRAALRDWLAQRGRPDLLRLGNEALDLLEGAARTVSAPARPGQGGRR